MSSGRGGQHGRGGPGGQTYSSQGHYKKSDYRGGQRTISARKHNVEPPGDPLDSTNSETSETEEESDGGGNTVLDSLEGMEDVPLTFKSMAAVVGELQRQQGIKVPGPRLCYVCASPEHLARDCPKNPRNQSGNGKEGPAKKPNRAPQTTSRAEKK